MKEREMFPELYLLKYVIWNVCLCMCRQRDGYFSKNPELNPSHSNSVMGDPNGKFTHLKLVYIINGAKKTKIKGNCVF